MNENLQNILLKLADLGIMPIIISLFTLFFIVTLVRNMNPAEQVTKFYIRINDQLIRTNEKKTFFDYNATYKRLKSNGVLFYIPQLKNPAFFIGFKVLIGLVTGAILSIIHPLLMIAGMLIGYKLLDVAMLKVNHSDNQKMQADIELIYNSLAVQIRANAYPIDAMKECYYLVQHPRMKAALLELNRNVIMNKSFKETLHDFSANFDNKYIQSLCIALEQSEESGRVIDLLNDISEQIKDFDKNLLEKQNEAIERRSTVAMLLLFSSSMGILFYLSAGKIIEEISGLGF